MVKVCAGPEEKMVNLTYFNLYFSLSLACSSEYPFKEIKYLFNLSKRIGNSKMSTYRQKKIKESFT